MSMPDLKAIINPRHQLLVTVANPARRLDYLVTINRQLALRSPARSIRLVIRYVPDMLILDQPSIPGYMRELEETAWVNLETLARSVLDDFSNELVSRWIEVSLFENGCEMAGTGFDYGITMEDRQPSWSNPQLLGRLKPCP